MSTARSFERDGLRGRLYEELPDDVLAHLPAWLDGDFAASADVVTIKPGRVARRGGVLIKRFPPTGRLRDRLRRPAALRSADWHERILPVRSPRPYLVVERDGARDDGASLLLCEFIEARTLVEAWHDDPLARSTFASFLAETHAQGVFHGDFHLRNALWDGSAWYLIDLDGMRTVARTLWRSRLIAHQWARTVFELQLDGGVAPDDVRPLWDLYCSRSGGNEPSWERIVSRAAMLLRRFLARTVAE